MDTQTAYEMMRVYLTRPGARRAVVVGNRWCSYETMIEGEVQRCAIGCLLSPQALAEGVATYQGGLDDVINHEDFPLAQEELADADFDFLSVAQGIHDDEHNWSDKGFNVSRLDDLAARYNLDVVKEEARAPREAVLV